MLSILYATIFLAIWWTSMYRFGIVLFGILSQTSIVADHISSSFNTDNPLLFLDSIVWLFNITGETTRSFIFMWCICLSCGPIVYPSLSKSSRRNVRQFSSIWGLALSSYHTKKYPSYFSPLPTNLFTSGTQNSKIFCEEHLGSVAVPSRLPVT